jgi:hypothetical protein
MNRVKVVWILGALTVVWISPRDAKSSDHRRVISCPQHSVLGFGPSYRGKVTNEDYALSADLPQGFAGWGGVADSAPFHGFVIFLDPKRQSCIWFEIHIRVDEQDSPQRVSNTRSFAFGHATGWQTKSSGFVNGMALLNVVTSFSSNLPDQTDDGSIVLITPPSKTEEALALYNSFLRSLTFRP